MMRHTFSILASLSRWNLNNITPQKNLRDNRRINNPMNSKGRFNNGLIASLFDIE